VLYVSILGVMRMKRRTAVESPQDVLFTEIVDVKRSNP